MNRILLLGLFLITTGFKSQELLPPLPKQEMDISSELLYIYNSDQFDRKLFLGETKVISSLDVNDSIRLSRVMEIDKKKLLLKPIDKYYAAFIYHHGGGTKMTDNMKYYLRTKELCNEVINIKKDVTLLDTISKSDFDKNKLIQIFKETIHSSLEMDTIIDKNTRETLYIVHQSLKKAAKTLLKFSKTSLKLLKNKDAEKEDESIKLNKLDDPIYLNKVRNKLKRKITKGMKENGQEIDSLQIEALIDSEIESLKNLKKNIIKDFQNKEGMFKEK